jgi:hypothetical protein
MPELTGLPRPVSSDISIADARPDRSDISSGSIFNTHQAIKKEHTMHPRTTRCTLLICLTIALLLPLLTACGTPATGTTSAGQSSAQSGGTWETEADPAASNASDTATSGDIRIETADGQLVALFHTSRSAPRIEYVSDGRTLLLQGELHDSGKHKYELEGRGRIAEVKDNDDGFKVRTPDGALLWKVKLNNNKIKISDNEESENPFVLDFKADDRIAVTADDETTDLGKVRLYFGEGRVKVKDAAENERYTSDTSQYSAMYGVLLLDTIPEPERYIIMAEILARGR